MKIKTSKLIGPALDWAVAKAEEAEYRYMASTGGDYNGNWWWETRHYSTNWSQGGPIIEREGICLYFNPEDADAFEWHAEDRSHALYLEGPTPLIAAMRCFVASRLGDEIDVPEELS